MTLAIAERLRSWVQNLGAVLLGLQHDLMLAVVWDGWRVRALAIGWEGHERTGERCAILHRVYIEPRYRGLSSIKKIRHEWDRAMRERGLTRMLTPIEKHRTNVAHLGTRAAGYRYYGEDRKLTWYFRDI